MLYRRFGFLQARLLLNKQDQLRELEEQLDAIDQSDDSEYLTSRDMDDADERPRTRLLRNIETKFKEYGMRAIYSSKFERKRFQRSNLL